MENKIILTNMCLVYSGDNILVQDRIKSDWPGINLPGGHVKFNESLEESCIREMKEETGLEVFNLEFSGVYEWNIKETHIRHLAVLYKTNSFKGEIKSSKEGRVFWIKKDDIKNYKEATDFSKVLAVILNYK